jgi:type IX secretion system PorP/SprF family membrane protein
MNKNNLKISILFLLFSSIVLNGQDIHFTQFYMSPLNLNPALTGVNNCKTRMIINYRNQWAGVLGKNAYNTYSASYDQKIPVGRDDYFGIGGSFWGDVAGASRFGTTQGRVSLSYSKKMAGKRKSASYLVIGADGALSSRSISQEDLRWPSQITATGFNPGIAGEVIQDANFLYPDIGAGILWFSVVNEHTNWYVGAAMHHLNRPNVSFLGSSVDLYSRYTLHGGMQFELQKKISLLPFAVILSQGPHRSLNAGANVRFALGKVKSANQSFETGLWYRVGNKTPTGIHSDAVILSTRFNLDNFGFGLSYDMNISGLRQAAPGNGAFEFSLVYNICGPENRSVYCPRF